MADGRRERNSSGAQVQTTRPGETESGIITIALFLSSRSLARSAPLILINRRQQDDRQRRRQRRLRERGKKHALCQCGSAVFPVVHAHTYTLSRRNIHATWRGNDSSSLCLLLFAPSFKTVHHRQPRQPNLCERRRRRRQRRRQTLRRWPSRSSPSLYHASLLPSLRGL